MDVINHPAIEGVRIFLISLEVRKQNPARADRLLARAKALANVAPTITTERK